MKNKKRIEFLEEQVELILEILLGEEEVVVEEEEQDFEVGKWYKNRSGYIRSRFTEKGRLNLGCQFDYWVNDTSMTDFSLWEEMTPEEIKEVLTKRCKELGLFDGEFECLTGNALRSLPTDTIYYWGKDDKLWLNGKLAYEKGKFAEKRITSTSKTEKEFIFKESELVEIENYVRFLDRTNVDCYKELILQYLRNKKIK